MQLSDYQTLAQQGELGAMSGASLGALKKALSVGHLPGNDPNNVSAGSLKLESLERTLKDLEYKEQDLAMFRLVTKLPAFSTVEEYERLTSYGADAGGFIDEGDLPEESDGTYERMAELVKYIGTTRSVTLQAQLVTTLTGNLVAHQAMAGTKHVMRKADRALSFGDARIVPQEWNGMFTLHRNNFTSLDAWQNSKVVIDLRGKHISEAAMEEAAQVIIDNHGSPDTFISPTKVISNFTKQFHGNKFIMPSAPYTTGGIVGQRVKTFASQFGDIDMTYDKFMDDQKSWLATDGANHAKAPYKPTKDATTPVSAATTDALSKYDANTAGDYYFAVAAVNKYGQSALEFLSTSKVAVAAGKAVDLKFAETPSSYTATGYIVYASAKNPAGAYNVTPMYPLFAVSAAELAAGYDGALAGVVRDRNRFIPNTNKALLMENTQDVWSFKQLAPIMKMDLARIATADRFMVLLFGTPQLYAPLKMVEFINVGAYVIP